MAHYWFRTARAINLQLFAEEKTEQPTPRRRQEARRKGQVFKSQELSSAVLFLGAFAAIYLLFPYMMDEFRILVHYTWQVPPGQVIWPGDFGGVFLFTMGAYARMVGPLLLVVLVLGILASLIQVGFLFSSDPLTPKLDRLNPIEGLKRIFSKKALVQLVKSILKLVVVVAVAFFLISQFVEPMSLLALMELSEGIRVVGHVAVRLGMAVGAILILVGVLDLYYQRWEHEQSLKMSKQEVKDEHKNIEGDPLIRSRIREQQRRLARQRMMEEVPRADVVVTNPIHLAVALRYNPGEMFAPTVVAKGRGYVARRIVEIADEHGVVRVRNPGLARGLFWALEVGQQVPESFYQAVAEVLAFVYRLHQKQA